MMHGNCAWFGERNTFSLQANFVPKLQNISTFFGRYTKGNLKMDELEVPSSASGELVLPYQVVI
jgi:hypothetical protein